MLYPHADIRLLPPGVNHSKGGIKPRMFVIHIMECWMAEADRLFRDPDHQASAHFGVDVQGHVRQWVSTTDTAWHAYDANEYGIGVEHAGFAASGLTSAQIQATGELYAWVHQVHPAVSLWINRRETGSGIAYHRKYPSWNLSGHTCPGDKAIAQIPAILKAAKAAA